MKRPLFLTGMMGCGKTTVGRVLAREQGLPLVDLDVRIERMFGASVPELFEARGEAGFREAEQLALRSLVDEPGFAGHGVVVATGGGAVVSASSRELMDRSGMRVFLEVSVDELVRRLRAEQEADPHARPLLHGGSLRLRVAELLAARGSSYRAGALCIDAHAEPSVVAARIMTALSHEASAGVSDVAFSPADALLGSEAV